MPASPPVPPVTSEALAPGASRVPAMAEGSAATRGAAGARFALATLVMLCGGTLLGAFAQMQQSELWPTAAAGSLVVLGLLCVFWALRSAARPRVPGVSRPVAAPWAGRDAHRGHGPRGAWAVAWPAGLALLGAAAVAFAAVSLRAQARLAEQLAPALEGRDLVVAGHVAELPRTDVLGTRFVFEVESATLDGAAVALPRRVSLAWYRGAEPDALLLGPHAEVRAGQRWRFTVRLKQPHGVFNPGGFDLELWLFERGIGATGTVRSRAGDAAVLLAAAGGAPVQRWRQHVRDAIERQLAGTRAAAGATGPDLAGIVAALALGDQAAIGRDDWELFRVTGVAHLMSISGLHVTMFAWLAAGVVGWLWRRSARAMHLVPAPLAARLGGVALALAYAVFAGWGVPAQRTVWMLATLALLHSLSVRWPLHVVLLVVAAVVVAVDPWALLQPGFWLSFAAVGLLAAAEPAGRQRTVEPLSGWALAHGGTTRWQRVYGAIGGALRTQAVATVGLAPLTLVFFQQVSLVGFVANLVAIPLVTLLVTPLALAGVFLAPLWDGAAWVLAALLWGLRLLAGGEAAAWADAAPAAWGDWAVWHAAAAPPWAVVTGLLGGLLAVLPWPWRLRVLALPLLLPLLAPAVARPPDGGFEFVALDVGQGTAALVRTRSHLLVYDAGPAYTPEADAGSRHLVPLLRRRGERQVDALVLSHQDLDHVGGAAALFGALPVRRLVHSLDEGHALLGVAQRGGATATRCEAGQRWQWDGVHFEVLHPSAADHAVPARRPNALSCVLRVRAGAAGTSGASLLLTGDIEAAQEATLVAREAEALAASVLLVPHHGSRTSSTPAFIHRVAPQVAVVQAAYRSRFGHPAPEVVARYEARGTALVRSDRCGAFTLGPGGEATCAREAGRRYWHHRAAEGRRVAK